VNFVLDTNAVSELRKPQPNPGFSAWVDAQDPARLFITTITIAEVWQGFHALPLNHADYGSIKRFASNLRRVYRVLKFDLGAAAAWGELTTKTGGPLPLRDSFIAAVAYSRGYSVVTRDTSPFQRMNCKVLNPWK